MSRRIRQTAFRLAFALAGAGLAVAGLVLLLRAGWLALELAMGPVWASLILGGALLVLGALVLALAQHRPRRPAEADGDLAAQLAGAFFQGLAAGRASRGQ